MEKKKVCVLDVFNILRVGISNSLGLLRGHLAGPHEETGFFF